MAVPLFTFILKSAEWSCIITNLKFTVTQTSNFVLNCETVPNNSRTSFAKSLTPFQWLFKVKKMLINALTKKHDMKTLIQTREKYEEKLFQMTSVYFVKSELTVNKHTGVDGNGGRHFLLPFTDDFHHSLRFCDRRH